MALSVLSQASAFNPGSELWIVPDLEKSQWTARLDWYLNFQLCKASRHVSPSIPNYLQEVLSETELPKVQFAVKTSHPLMIASEELLPNKWVVIVPWQDNLGPWIAQVFEVWHKLKEPSLRLFLPPGQSAGKVQQEWQVHHSFQDFTVVLD
ncbi:hypothetical protein [Bdellovibrio bacteriovorus]|uniref:Uncharacterized protein n=1 Tax=Bdellovibrio bacteriovorus TaxID=959 RepID=A0A150WKT6_BDEBC|nr:hypothetical protein [Bdellovibrio bacteriovorus]KYG64544.1 hypothetical protein AZI85_03785 [Bdellovibrio bacteriovorus]